MILSQQKILGLIREKQLLENYSQEYLGGTGYDLRVGRAYKIESPGFISPEKQINAKVRELFLEKYSLRPNEYILVESLERVKMPSNIMARILPRSSLFRMGCSLITAVVDPGFQGTLTMGLKNLSEQEFIFQKEARIAQIVFEEVTEKTKKYEGRYQGGKVI